MEENDNDLCREFDDFISAGAKYKAMKESLKIDFDTIRKEIELDEMLKMEETQIKTVPDNHIKTCELKKVEKKSSKNGMADGKNAENETNHYSTRSKRRTRRDRKRISDPLDESTQEKQRHISDEPICIPDSPVNIHSSPEKTVVENNVIYVSSEDELEHCLDISIPAEDDDNYEISVKVWWKFIRFDKFNIRRFQKLATLFQHYSKQESVAENQILLTLNDVPLHPNDTPDSLKLTIANIIEGGVTSGEDKSGSSHQESALSKDEMELKVQRKGCKEPLVIRILKTQKMNILMLKCAETLELPLEKLKFSFDGETLSSSDTPDDLDLEGGECIDLHILE